MPHLAKTVSSKLANTLAVSLARLTVPEIESIARLTAQQAAAHCFRQHIVHNSVAGFEHALYTLALAANLRS